jgi:MazG family protein
MQEPSALGRIVDLVRDLRARCPWDAAQTPASLRPYLVEEVMELDHAIGQDDDRALLVELGDVLLHVAFQVVLAEEAGRFGAEDLARAVEQKMWRRHPHLFPDQAPATAAGPQSWERTKLREPLSGRSVLAGLPPGLPALVHALRLQERAAGVGFDWPDASGPRRKITEELEELDTAIAQGDGRVLEEVGDALFALVNLARKLAVDPRSALERANVKFETRFRMLEALAEARGIPLGSADLETLDALWDEVKLRGDVLPPGSPTQG